MFIQIPDNIFFTIFMLLSITSSFLIIHTSKIIYSILYLIFFFINVACLLLLLKIEFLSILIVLVYISAITIFFLFIVMTVNIKITGPNLDETRAMDKPYLTVISFIFFFESFNFFKNNFELDLNPKFFENIIIDTNFAPVSTDRDYITGELMDPFWNTEIQLWDMESEYSCLRDPYIRAHFDPYYEQNKIKAKDLFEEGGVVIDTIETNRLLPEQIYYAENALPVDFSSIYSGFEFHSIFYNSFLIELLTVGLILLISLLGIVVLASNNRGRFLNKINIKKNKIFLVE